MLSIIYSVTVGRFSVYHIVHRIQVSFVSVSVFSIHAARQNCGELSQDTFSCPHAGCLLCILSDQTIHIHIDYGQVCRVVAHATMSAAVHPSCDHPHHLRALPSHSEYQKLR